MEFKNIKVYGLKESIIRSSYPMQVGEPEDLDSDMEFLDELITEQDFKRAFKLSSVPIGSGHDTWLKGVIIQFDIRYPEYFTPQLQRYHWIDIVSSQSKMHKIMSRHLNKNDFVRPINENWIDILNEMIDNKQFEDVINCLPSGYMKWMAISSNYLQMKTIWNQRCKHKHKLKEWAEFGDFIKSLPMSELITSKINQDENKN